MFNKVKNFFNYNKKINKNKKVENEIIYGQILQEKSQFLLLKLLKNSFNIEKYKFKENYVQYYQAKLKPNLFTIKNKSYFNEKNDFNY